MNPPKNGLRSQAGLMILSQCVLGGFLAFWLAAQYRQEKRELRDLLLLKLGAEQSKATDAAIFNMLLIPMLEKGIRTDTMTPVNFTIRQRRSSRDTAFINKRQREVTAWLDKERSPENGTSKVSHSSNAQREIKVLEQVQQLLTKMQSDSFPVRQPGIRQHFEVRFTSPKISDNIADSIRMFVQKTDTATIRKSLLLNIASSGLPFDLFWTTPPPAILEKFHTNSPGMRANPTELIAATAPDMLLPVGYVMAEDLNFLGVSHYHAYLLRRLLPQAGFAIVLLGITGAAFFVAYRSLRQQRRLSLMKEELVSNMSHELKTPVATVKVALEALGAEEVLSDRSIVHDYLSMASAEVTRLELLINQTLHSSLLEQGRMRISRAPLDLRQLLRTVVHSVRLRAEEARIDLIVPDETAFYNGDNLQLQGVVLNLLDNALKYAGSKAAIQIALEELDSAFRITVSDNGPGIPDQYLYKIFDKFFRVPTANRHDVKGYGLGLSYAAQVVRHHGGTIAAVNRPEGGAAFSITLLKQNSPA